MLVSLNWLKEFVDIHESAEQIAELLTMGGIEIEAVEHHGQSLDNILVAEVQNIKAHPSADNLRLVTVNIGEGGPITLVCGAPNVALGQKVAYAGLGTSLAGGVTILERDIRGVKSVGMLCSEHEMGIGEDASGIMILDEDCLVGKKLADAMPYLVDDVLETSVTPNRGDCLSIVGIAREVAALLGREWHLPAFTIEESAIPVESKIAIEIADPDLCPRYVGKYVENVSIKPSLPEVRYRLSRSGVRPISNVVDVTNLVLLECGQPLHAFDYDLLEDQRIIVRRCAPGETFVTLDGNTRNLPENALMIRDGKRAVALAGIMGGLNSEINDATKRVLIESACFEPFGIRRTSKKIGLSTEASYRFERGIDPEGTYWAADRCAYLMQKHAGGEVAKASVDVYPNKIVRKPVCVRTPKVNVLLGTDLGASEMDAHLSKLSIKVERDPSSAETLICTSPSWRWDLEREVDYAEEVARIYGFQNILTTMPSLTSAPDHSRDHHGMLRQVASILNSSGYTEIVTMSFISQDAFDEFDVSETNGLSLLNPLSEETTVMRTSLISGLLATAKRNINFRSVDLKLFEIGRTFIPLSGLELPREDLKLAFLATGNRNPFLWNLDRTEKIDFYDVKGALENLLEEFNVDGVELRRGNIPFLHPGKSADIYVHDENIGFIGELSPIKLRKHEIEEPVYICEVLLEPIFAGLRKHEVFRPLPRYPYIERDLSIIVEEKVSGDMIKRLISRLGHDIITSVNLFDLYRGESIPKGHQSVAFRIRYQSENRTLTDEEVQEVHSHLLTALSQEFGASIRE